MKNPFKMRHVVRAWSTRFRHGGMDYDEFTGRFWESSFFNHHDFVYEIKTSNKEHLDELINYWENKRAFWNPFRDKYRARYTFHESRSTWTCMFEYKKWYQTWKMYMTTVYDSHDELVKAIANWYLI